MLTIYKNLILFPFLNSLEQINKSSFLLIALSIHLLDEYFINANIPMKNSYLLLSILLIIVCSQFQLPKSSNVSLLENVRNGLTFLIRLVRIFISSVWIGLTISSTRIVRGSFRLRS